MFKDSLVDSGGRLKTNAKYWVWSTLVFNICIIITMIIFPLINPLALPATAMMAMLTAPPPPPPSPPPPPAAPVKVIKAVEVSDAMTVPKIPKRVDLSKEEAPPPPQTAGVIGMTGMGGSGAASSLFSGMGVAPAPPPVTLKAKSTGPASISGGVIAGNILVKTQPTYPPIAKQAHVQGAVVLHALISKTGLIEKLTVVSGNAMLTQAAVDAVQNWRYKPYLLNGEPTEVDTTVTVNFSFGGGA